MAVVCNLQFSMQETNINRSYQLKNLRFVWDTGLFTNYYF